MARSLDGPRRSTSSPPTSFYQHMHKRTRQSFAALLHAAPLTTFRCPPVFLALVALLDWPDLLALLNTAVDLRLLFDVPFIKDAILSRFVPGFFSSLRSRDLVRYQDVRVSIHDLDLLLISQRFPLHRYPMHALKTMSSLPTLDEHDVTSRLIDLTRAHSRFVLLLQALVHSSTAPLQPEPDELRSALPSKPLRELSFPAPLSYSVPSSPPSRRSSNLSTASSTRLRRPHRPSADNLSSMIPTRKPSRRLSTIFGKGFSPATPPPPSEPRTLQHYSTNWRRTLFHSPTASLSEDDEPLERPHRRFVTTSSSRSSFSNPSPLSLSRIPTPTIDPASTPAQGPIASPPRLESPHDLALATSRTRAPILRVFVPCSELSDGTDSVLLCEEQLIEAGLWAHLSTGDVICNLGYVPPAADDSSTASHSHSRSGSGSASDEVGHSTASSSPSSSPHRTGGRYRASHSSAHHTWLIFNGSFLVPYTPPDALPLDDPLSLPSPNYYMHIFPAHANPRFILDRLPPCSNALSPQLTLVHTTVRVRSPHSPSGYAVVKKYVWTARVTRRAPGADEDEGVGEGWCQDWVFEGEGTREGRQLLVDCLRGRAKGKREWELVRDKCVGGTMWLQLVHSDVVADEGDDTDGLRRLARFSL